MYCVRISKEFGFWVEARLFVRVSAASTLHLAKSLNLKSLNLKA